MANSVCELVSSRISQFTLYVLHVKPQCRLCFYVNCVQAYYAPIECLLPSGNYLLYSKQCKHNVCVPREQKVLDLKVIHNAASRLLHSSYVVLLKVYHTKCME